MARHRVAFFSPLPPTKSGIADYAEALLEPLRQQADVTVFTEVPAHFDPASFDSLLYQMGNNPYHDFTYALALQHPGVVVMHESNLHHLIAERTIKRGDWDAYVEEVVYDGGDRADAERVRRLEVGPDYEGVPMLRRLLERQKGVIAHSQYVVDDLRRAGFTGPAAVIPHGAWIPLDADRLGARERLGLGPRTPLVGIFGFLKPYKRIAESLRAFRRLLRVEPAARMILVGEPHPDLQLDHLLGTLELRHAVRVLGFTPIEQFTSLIAACDVVLNLRFPTVGESSGTLLRALGLGRAVLVSEIGSFRELPGDICLKVPVGPTEEELIYEYLNLLVARPDLAQAMGQRAADWVSRDCSWPVVAESYVRFLEAVHEGRPYETKRPVVVETASVAVEPADVANWVADPSAREYLDHHAARFAKTLELTPPGDSSQRILEMGAYMQITPALRYKLGYGEVRGCYFGSAGQTDSREVTSETGEHFACLIDLFDAEHDVYPYPDGHFDTVLCCELIEHLKEDPMHLLTEVNRILKPSGHFLLTTPNIASLRAISAILHGYHPGFFPAYLKPPVDGDARHAREYTAKEGYLLLHDAGFEVVKLETGPFREEPRPELAWVATMLRHFGMPEDLRGDGLYVLGRKVAGVRSRYPGWLYS
ncbi:MAG: methyltransferase domain-containing protein [Bryobacteraceae bacterium]|nr:methyltransferase domain-containing protein [Bryobacteraceae bacterium]